MRAHCLGIAALIVALASGSAADAREKAQAATSAGKASNATDKKPQAPPPPGWRSHCETAARDAPLTCVVEETAVLTNTGQVVVGFSIRMPPDAKAPLALIQIPTGVFLPNGIQVQIDDGATLNLPLQTCEERGCFAGATLAPDVIEKMRSGKTLKLSFTDLARQTLTVTLPLNGFGPAYDKIK